MICSFQYVQLNEIHESGNTYNRVLKKLLEWDLNSWMQGSKFYLQFHCVSAIYGATYPLSYWDSNWFFFYNIHGPTWSTINLSHALNSNYEESVWDFNLIFLHSDHLKGADQIEQNEHFCKLFKGTWNFRNQFLLIFEKTHW